MIGRRSDILDAFAYETLSVGAAAGSLTASVYNPSSAGQPAQGALLTAEGGSIRFREDGGTPTASVGHVVAAGGSINIYGVNNIRKFSAIAVSDLATVGVTYYR